MVDAVLVGTGRIDSGMAKPCKCGSTDLWFEKYEDNEVGTMFKVKCLKCGRDTAKKFTLKKALRVWASGR